MNLKDEHGSDADIIVSKPDVALQYAFYTMLEDFDRFDPHNGEYYAAARPDFAAYVKSQLHYERGENMQHGRVPCTHRWLLKDGVMVGNVRIRHNIDTHLLATEHGHIGYDVPPSQRGQGYGTATLLAGIECARQIGLTRALVFSDTDNPASWRIIERCSGVLEEEKMSEYYGVLVRKYWIEL
jgi:predicted acetyltransferase